MAIKSVVTTPNKILETKCEKVKEINDQTKIIIKDLVDTLRSAHHPDGAGLAAPQIGVLKDICIVRNFIQEPGARGKLHIQEFVLINPKIISQSKETTLDWEGCLSIPDTFGMVRRANKVKVRALNENGEDIQFSAQGFFARVIQHEVDHLNGILFTTKIEGKTLTEKQLDDLYEGEE